MTESLLELLREVRSAKEVPGSFGYLGGIAEALEALQLELDKQNPDSSRIERLATGIARVVTESDAFAASPLGNGLLDFADELTHGKAGPRGSIASSASQRLQQSGRKAREAARRQEG